MSREILEELGVEIKDFSKIEIAKIQTKHNNSNTINNYFAYVFFAKVDYDIKDYTIQKDELSELKYITLEELEEIVKNKDNNYTFSDRDNTNIIEYLYKQR